MSIKTSQAILKCSIDLKSSGGFTLRQCKTQTADCGLQTADQGKMQTVYKMQTAD